MGFAVPDIARTEEDFRQLNELARKYHPNTLPPPFGKPGHKTYVIRDEDDRTKIKGMLHVEQALEVKLFIVDDSYEYQKMSTAILHRHMEGRMREDNVECYYFTVPSSDERTIKMFRKDGAEPIDLGALRFMKRL